MKLYDRDYIKEPPTKEETELYKLIRNSECVDGRKFRRLNRRSEYPEAIRHAESLFPNNHIELFDFQKNGLIQDMNQEFHNIIHDENSNERDILRFVNQKPAYHIVAGILRYYNFGHHDAYLFPEYMLGKYRADYLLVGKSSGGYEFVFVEFELPNGRVTLQSGHEGQAPRKGTYQVYDWKSEIEADFQQTIGKLKQYSNKTYLPEEFVRYDSSRVHYTVVAGLRDDYNDITYRDRRNKAREQDILLLHYDNLYDKACELERAQTF